MAALVGRNARVKEALMTSQNRPSLVGGCFISFLLFFLFYFFFIVIVVIIIIISSIIFFLLFFIIINNIYTNNNNIIIIVFIIIVVVVSATEHLHPRLPGATLQARGRTQDSFPQQQQQ